MCCREHLGRLCSSPHAGPAHRRRPAQHGSPLTDADERPRSPVPDGVCGGCRLVGVRPGEPLHRAAATEGDRAVAGTADGHALSGGHRQYSLDQQHQARGPRARIRAGDKISGRPGREEGHAFVRDRAPALQGPAGAGASGGGGRQGDARQCRSRIHPAAGAPGQGRLDTSQPRQGTRQPRYRAGQCAASAGQYPERGDHTRLYHGVGPV